jgi:hypothetical protein
MWLFELSEIFLLQRNRIRGGKFVPRLFTAVNDLYDVCHPDADVNLKKCGWFPDDMLHVAGN